MIKNLIKKKKKLIFLQAHDPFSAILIDKIYFKNKNKKFSFDGLWSSSLADSIIQGVPDEEILGLYKRIKDIFNIRSVSKLPIIMDADSGGNFKYFSHYIKIMQQVGINAVVIEDKKGIKKNSLLGKNNNQKLEDIEKFCYKINLGKKNIYKKNFSLIARMEGLIYGLSINDTLNRSYKSIKAGADCILIHSISKSSKQVINFSKIFKKKYPYIPLICIPTTYYFTKYTDLHDNGIDIVIYANHLIRSYYKITKKIIKSILKNKRTYEIEKQCISIKKILNI